MMNPQEYLFTLLVISFPICLTNISSIFRTCKVSNAIHKHVSVFQDFVFKNSSAILMDFPDETKWPIDGNVYSTTGLDLGPYLGLSTTSVGLVEYVMLEVGFRHSRRDRLDSR